MSLGKRKNKYLKSLEGPDIRWVVSCSACPKKWHACHFLCGHLQKISSIGSSDIIRHEQGRFNRWLKKIKPPCSLNPRSDALKKEYQLAKISFTSDKKSAKDKDEPTAIHDHNDNTADIDIRVANDDKSSISDEENSNSCIEQTPMNENHPSFDNDFKSMLGSLDKDTLDVSGVEVATMDEEFLTGCPNAKSSQSGEEPSHKKVKVEEEFPIYPSICPLRNANTSDDVDDLCDEIILKCTLLM